VEYLTQLLTSADYAVSHIYGTLDQHARSSQMERFRKGFTSILVVTDVAARGIDIPILENVINYDFSRGARVFVHRVGRTARAGKKGWAWSFVNNVELPFLIDLQLFLGRPFKHEVEGDSEVSYAQSLVLGPFSREQIDEDLEYVATLDEKDATLPTLRAVMIRGHGMYERSQGKASAASYARGKEMLKDSRWGFSGLGAGVQVHPALRRGPVAVTSKVNDTAAKNALLKAVTEFRPAETVFEIGSRGKNQGASVMKDRRKALGKAQMRIVVQREDDEKDDKNMESTLLDEDEMEGIEVSKVLTRKNKAHCIPGV
jgi:ATP-dependent RNA helicase DDX54/DBP10